LPNIQGPTGNAVSGTAEPAITEGAEVALEVVSEVFDPLFFDGG
jgi:hypothetical protein